MCLHKIVLQLSLPDDILQSFSECVGIGLGVLVRGASRGASSPSSPRVISLLEEAAPFTRWGPPWGATPSIGATTAIQNSTGHCCYQNDFFQVSRNLFQPWMDYTKGYSTFTLQSLISSTDFFIRSIVFYNAQTHTAVGRIYLTCVAKDYYCPFELAMQKVRPTLIIIWWSIWLFLLRSVFSWSFFPLLYVVLLYFKEKGEEGDKVKDSFLKQHFLNSVISLLSWKSCNWAAICRSLSFCFAATFADARFHH